MMKAAVFLTVSAAIGLQVAAAVPHGHGHHEHIKKDLITETVTETEYVTAFPTDPAVVVWVDTEGNIVSTETRAGFGSGATNAPETTSSVAKTTNETPIASIFTAPPPTLAAPLSTSSSMASSSPPPASTASTIKAPPVAQATSAGADFNVNIAPSATPSTDNSKQSSNTDNDQFSGLGIGYDILNDIGQCKSASTVAQDFNTMVGYSIIRIYGTTCNQVHIVAAEAAQRGMKVFAGINDPTVDVASAVQEILSQAGSNLDVIDTINIGNEWVNDNGPGAVPVVTAALAAARAALSGVFGGRIVTVDTVNAFTAHPALCAASDYCAANCHAFFAAGTDAAGAGEFVQSQVAAVAAANPGKSIVITESGWAWADHNNTPNPKATKAQQDAAIASLRGTFSSNLFLFQGFDTLYKGIGYEGYFGIYDHDD